MAVEEVPFFVPDVGDEEIEQVVDTLRSGWLTTGPKTKQFEQQFAEYVGAKHAVAVNSATAALHLALDALDVAQGDEVIVPTMTFAATAEVVVHLKARPILVDCLPGTLNLDPDQFQRAITPRTKAVIPVHYAGQPCDMDAILEIARQHGVRVVEDAAHALPARHRDRTIGTIGDATCFSFYANKTITTGEGGMLTTDDDEVADRVRIRSLHGMSRDAWKRFSTEGSWYYEVVYPGYKYNMADIAAAMGLVQLSRAEQMWQSRCRAAERYRQRFESLPEVQVLDLDATCQHAWHLFVIRLQTDRLTIDRNAFIEQLRAHRVGTSVHYIPLHMHPYYRDGYGYEPADLPAAESAYRRIITLPLFSRITTEQVDYVANCVERIVSENRR